MEHTVKKRCIITTKKCGDEERDRRPEVVNLLTASISYSVGDSSICSVFQH